MRFSTTFQSFFQNLKSYKSAHVYINSKILSVTSQLLGRISPSKPFNIILSPITDNCPT